MPAWPLLPPSNRAASRDAPASRPRCSRPSSPWPPWWGPPTQPGPGARSLFTPDYDPRARQHRHQPALAAGAARGPGRRGTGFAGRCRRSSTTRWPTLHPGDLGASALGRRWPSSRAQRRWATGATRRGDDLREAGGGLSSSRWSRGCLSVTRDDDPAGHAPASCRGAPAPCKGQLHREPSADRVRRCGLMRATWPAVAPSRRPCSWPRPFVNGWRLTAVTLGEARAVMASTWRACGRDPGRRSLLAALSRIPPGTIATIHRNAYITPWSAENSASRQLIRGGATIDRRQSPASSSKPEVAVPAGTVTAPARCAGVHHHLRTSARSAVRSGLRAHPERLPSPTAGGPVP